MEVDAPRFRHNGHVKMVRLSALHTDRLYPTGKIPGTYFWRVWVDSRLILLQEKIVTMEDSSDTIGNRTRIPCFTVKMFVMSFDIVLYEQFTVFGITLWIFCWYIANQFDLTFQHLDENDIDEFHINSSNKMAICVIYSSLTLSKSLFLFFSHLLITENLSKVNVSLLQWKD